MKLFIEQETLVIQHFLDMSRLVLEKGDFTTFNFLRWFVDEQVEEIAIANLFWAGTTRLARCTWCSSNCFSPNFRSIRPMKMEVEELIAQIVSRPSFDKLVEIR